MHALASQAVNRPVTRMWPLWMKRHNDLADGPAKQKVDLLMIGDSIISNLHDNKTIFYPEIGHVFLNKDKTLNKTLIKDTVHSTTEGFEVWAKARKRCSRNCSKSRHHDQSQQPNNRLGEVR